ncbi:hypothetical protein CXF74_13015 [Psychromonas sp. Urea-02u-13]|nr:hypothetical protein CXF74_13015 [Psychromonas sp. Urea-02u-13]
MNNYNANLKLTQAQGAQKQPVEAESTTQNVSPEKKQVSLSTEGKALLAAESEKAPSKPVANVSEQGFGDKVESFAYGALGIDHPDDLNEETDSSYSAGQYLKGALSVGALLLAVV